MRERRGCRGVGVGGGGEGVETDAWIHYGFMRSQYVIGKLQDCSFQFPNC